MKKYNHKMVMTKKVNTLFKTDEVKLSKSMSLFLKLIHILYSYDLGGFNIKTKKMKRVAKVISITKSCFVGIVTFVIIHVYQHNTTSHWYYLMIFQNILTAAMFAFFDTGITFADHQKNLLKFDMSLAINRKSQHLDYKMLIFASACIILRSSIVVFYCFVFDDVCIRPMFARYLLIFLWLSFDVILIIYFFIFYATYWRLSSIISIIDNSSGSVVYLQYLYKGIIDSIEKGKAGFDVAYILIIFYNGPGVMYSIYGSLKEIQKNGYGFVPGITLGYITNIYSFILMFLPPLCAGMLTWKAEEIKIALHNRLLLENDKKNYSDIKRFMTYVEARPFSLRACRVIPLDFSLPIIALNLCVTYLIVIIQFTHLY